MNSGGQDCRGQDCREHDYRGLTLLPQRAVFQRETRTLWIADLHLGKAASFRALGQPAPPGTTQENLARLDALIDAQGARRLVVLGDFLHARTGATPALFSRLRDWRAARRDLECVVVRGNHDRHAGDAPADCGFRSVDEPFLHRGVEGWHHVAAAEGKSDGEAGDEAEQPLLLSGHLHPVVRLSGPVRDRLRLPCFCLRGRELVLPSFGEFTGGFPVDARDWDALIVTTGERLYSLPVGASRV